MALAVGTTAADDAARAALVSAVGAAFPGIAVLGLAAAPPADYVAPTTTPTLAPPSPACDANASNASNASCEVPSIECAEGEAACDGVGMNACGYESSCTYHGTDVKCTVGPGTTCGSCSP